jgi:hypothetical protein
MKNVTKNSSRRARRASRFFPAAALFLAGALLVVGCAVPVFGPGARDYIVVADIAQVPESDAFGMTGARIEGDSLKLAAIYTGGCRKHVFTLYAARASSGADTAYLYVQHDADHDVCEMLVSGEPLAFNLRGLKDDLGLGGKAVLRSAPQWDSGFALEY